MCRLLRCAVGALSVVFALMVAGPAGATAAVTITLPARADLTAKILGTVPVTVACGPYEQSMTTTGLSVTLEQAVAHGVATGRGSLDSVNNPPFGLTCDGAAHVYSVAVTADPTGPPFKSGNAIISGGANVVIGPCCSNIETGSVGPQAIKLR